ncbi:MAG: hypothetical protein M0R38_12995 [Bacteroidia bacterium]|jgi:biopolymer transport protein ExbD|nr:hypothetical protein [Bacteroidia bacterium]
MRRRKINGTQPSDIAFLLILFFLVLIITSVEYSLNVDTNSGLGSEEKGEIFNLTLSSKGLFAENKKIDEVTLNSLLKTGQKTNLTVEGSVPWQDVVSVLSVLNRKEISVNLRQM